MSDIQAADLEHGRGRPDPRALALAGELQDRLPDAQVLLFGSRAMGNWQAGSDIDLAVIGSNRDTAEAALAQSAAFCAELYAGHDRLRYGVSPYGSPRSGVGRSPRANASQRA